MTKEISDNIKSLNVVLTLLIVALHTMVWEQRMWPLRGIVNMAVPMFFVISSYLYFQRWQPTLECYLKKLRSRLFSLYLPFVFYNLLYVPYILLKTSVLHGSDERHITVFSVDMLSSVFIGWPWLPNTVTWYLLALLLFAVFAPLLAVACRNRWLFVAAMVVSLLCSHRFAYISLGYWLPCLLLGSWLAFNEGRVNVFLHAFSRVTWQKAAFTVISIACIIVFTIVLRDADVFTSKVYYCFRMLSPYIIIMLVAAYGVLVPRCVVTLLSAYTLPIYCLHVVFVNMSVLLVHRVLPGLHFAVAQLLCFTMAVTAVTVLCFALSRVKPLWKIMTGFRG